VEFHGASTLRDIKDSILEQSKEKIISIIFYTIDGNIIPLSESVKDSRTDVILLQINGKRLFAINLNDDFSIEHAGTRILVGPEPDHFAEFQTNFGLKKSEKYIFPGFLRKIAVSLPKGNSFSNKDVSESVSNALRYLQYQGDSTSTSLMTKPLAEHHARLNELE